MFKKANLLAGLGAAAVVLSALASPARAEAPDRVPRIMMARMGSYEVPLEWDAEEAVAMIVSPKTSVIGPDIQTFVHAVDYDWYGNVNYSVRMYNAIVSTLQANLAERIVAGEITEEELTALADILFEFFDGKQVSVEHQVNLVAKGGPERLMNVYFDHSDMPPRGARTKAGPDGDVLVLGYFFLHHVSAAEAAVSYGGMAEGELAVTTRGDATDMAYVAIGWFTK